MRSFGVFCVKTLIALNPKFVKINHFNLICCKHIGTEELERCDNSSPAWQTDRQTTVHLLHKWSTRCVRSHARSIPQRLAGRLVCPLANGQLEACQLNAIRTSMAINGRRQRFESVWIYTRRPIIHYVGRWNAGSLIMTVSAYTHLHVWQQREQIGLNISY